MRLRGLANAVTCTSRNLRWGQAQIRTTTSISLGETTTGASLYVAVETAMPGATLRHKCASCLSEPSVLYSVDAPDMQQTVWPRLAAIAEKLWSARTATAEASAALPRLHAFRCLLNDRGVAAAPVENPTARAAPPKPGRCLEQRRRR